MSRSSEISIPNRILTISRPSTIPNTSAGRHKFHCIGIWLINLRDGGTLARFAGDGCWWLALTCPHSSVLRQCATICRRDGRAALFLLTAKFSTTLPPSPALPCLTPSPRPRPRTITGRAEFHDST